ncbi:16S rRNA processing protein RimM [Luminiphilus syltensis NOR5-1B]|uniref:Ribosome maturation factor RimM n=1 Tax=Luminiphilus syltensis NOR5-1B TaxID=565045 RepID=B8KXD1_9GAMM|nr:ribosome maturation factor RimM [Luminiphilus syltensis]EED36614.1 16S rRNA processing protein RimM [Luminiphilus syltensis NOR5-1B]
MLDRLTVASIAGVYGIKGWVKLRLFVEDPDTLAQLEQLEISPPAKEPGGQGTSRPVVIDSVRKQGRGTVAHIVGIDDRDSAEALRRYEITVPREGLPDPADGEYYWHQLQGLAVWCREGSGDAVCVGRVAYLLETGANDVLVVAPTAGSIDDSERLIPLLFDEVVKEVDLERREIWVDWFLDA